MKPAEQQQVIFVINQLIKQKKSVPYLQDLDAHPLYWSFFHDLSPEERDEIKHLIDHMIREDIASRKTKGWEMFKRFYELHADLFWEFRALNSTESNLSSPIFHKLWGEIEKHLYHFEQILVKNMMRRPEGLEKVTDAFYDIAYKYFPFYARIESK